MLKHLKHRYMWFHKLHEFSVLQERWCSPEEESGRQAWSYPIYAVIALIRCDSPEPPLNGLLCLHGTQRKMQLNEVLMKDTRSSCFPLPFSYFLWLISDSLRAWYFCWEIEFQCCKRRHSCWYDCYKKKILHAQIMAVHGKLINEVYKQENWYLKRESKKENIQSSKNIYKFYKGNERIPTEES